MTLREFPDRYEHHFESLQGCRCVQDVATWRSGVAEDDLWVSPLVLGEIRKGVEQARRHDLQRAETLGAWLAEVNSCFGDRVLPVDAAVAEQWGRRNAIRSAAAIVALLVATAKAHGPVLVTRNAAGVAGLDVDVQNPFEGRGGAVHEIRLPAP